MKQNNKFTPHSCFDNAWLGLGDIANLELDNPLIGRTPQEIENPGLRELRLMKHPDYLAFAVKYLLNIELLPIQALILKELWTRPFPMLIASRGFSKCISKDTWIQTNNGFSRLYDVIDTNININQRYYPNNLLLYGENGFNEVEYYWKNNRQSCLRIKTSQGFKLSGTYEHPIRAVREGNIEWVKLRDIKIGDYVPIDRSQQWFENTNDLSEDIAYLFGCLVGDGGYTVRGRISFTTKDEEIVQRLNITTQKLWNKVFRKQKDKYGYLLCGVKIWDELFQKYGFNSSVCGEKDFPLCILSAKKSSVAAFIRGLFDTDDTCRKQTKVLSCSAKSRRIINTLQFVLTKFGIISRCYKYYNKKYNRYYYSLTICGEHVIRFYEEIGFGLSYKQKLLSQNIKIINNTNLDIIPHNLILDDLLALRQRCSDDNFNDINNVKWHSYYLKIYQTSYKKLQDILDLTIHYQNCDEWQRLKNIFDKHYFYDPIISIHSYNEDTFDFHIPNDHSFITNGFISHNTFLNAVLSILKCLLIPKTKIVIAGAAFRQSKFVFEYMETIWRNAPILRSVCNSSSGPRRSTDQWVMYINDSTATAIPIGSGEKIRGLRANTLIVEEFACLEKNTLVQTDIGLIRIKDFLDGHAQCLLNMNNEFEYPDTIYRTPKTDVYKITTQNGYFFSCSSIHKTLTTKGWKLAKDLTKDDLLELNCNNYFPSNYIQYKDIVVDEKLGWLLGLLVSEGTITNRNYIGITTTDNSLQDQIIKSNINIDWKIYIKDPYQDPRGWMCKKSFFLCYHNTQFRESLYDLGLNYVTSHRKDVPWSILQSPRSVVIEFLKGLFIGDGSGFQYIHKGKKNIGIAYYSVSEDLINTLQVLLLKFQITGSKVAKKSHLSQNVQWMLSFRAENAVKLYNLLKLSKWQHLIQDAHYLKRKPGIYKYGNRFIVQTTRGNKNIHLGIYDTKQECKVVFQEYWNNVNPCFRVKSVEKLKDQQVLYDFYLPKTHSFYGNGFIQHNSINPEIYETVLAGFTAVSADPISNVKESARRNAMTEAGTWSDRQEESYMAKTGNQIIISGTASYDFEHFADYWRRYRSIIASKGDQHKLEEILGREIPKYFNWKDYSIVRIPYELIPEGFMDDKQIIRAKATMHSGTYGREYGAVFVKDSNGFFKRTLIESCVVNDQNMKKEQWPSWCPSKFEAVLRGNSNRKYVYGIDPASEQDNFSIVIIELWAEHARIVYGWSTNKKDFNRRLKAGLISEHDFYGFTARKIRDLMTLFPCERIGMDAQGGGIAVAEALHDPDKLKTGEIVIWPIIDQDKEKDTDYKPGLHILELCQFSQANWVAEANHGLRKDMEDKVLLFPFFDAISLGLAVENDKRQEEVFRQIHQDESYNIYDSLEDCVMELEELKNELSTIVMTKAGMGVDGRDRWSTPEIKLETGKKGRLRKDRYSALLIANMIARQISRTPIPIQYEVMGGASHTIGKVDGSMYNGPEWFTENMNMIPIFGIRH